MAHAPAVSNLTAASPDPSGASSGLLGSPERQDRLFAALHTSLADGTLPALPADVRALFPSITWAQLAEIMRVTRPSSWRRGLSAQATAVPHQLLWLVLGGGAPSPVQLKGGHHRALVLALVAKVEERFESEAIAEDKRAKKLSNYYDRPAARARVASCAPWSAPVDASLLRALMTDPTGASAKLDAALHAAKGTRGEAAAATAAAAPSAATPAEPNPKTKRCRPADADDATPTTRPPLTPLPPATIQALSSKLGRQNQKELRAERAEHQSFQREAAKSFTALEAECGRWQVKADAEAERADAEADRRVAAERARDAAFRERDAAREACTDATLAAGRAQRMAERALVRTEAAETAEYEAEEARKAAEEALADWQRGERKEVQQSKQQMLAERRARLAADRDREAAEAQAAAAVAGLAEAEAEAEARRQQAAVAADAQQDAENSLAEAEQDHADALQRQARAARRQTELAVEEALKAASIEDSIRMQGLRDRAAASKQAETRAKAAVAEANRKVAAAAAEAQAQARLVHSLRTSQGMAREQAATDRECKVRARAEAAEVLDVAESLSRRLECALAAVRDRDAALTRLQADLAERAAEKRTSSARAPTAMVIKPHVPGAPWPLEQRAIARDIMTHTGLAPSRFNIAYSGFFTLFTGQVPTTPYMCDAMFGKQCFDINGTLDDVRSAIANAKSPWPWALATDDGSAKGMCAVHTKNEKLHVIIASSWDPVSNLPYIEGVALRDPPSESGKGLAECNINALNEAGYKWPTFVGSGGDHTDHASGKIGERVKVQEYAESHGCPAGRGSSNGCSRHGYALEVKAAFNALLGHQDVESAALALYNCSALDRQLVSLCWDACGLPEHLLKVFHSASKPTMSKWQVFEGFVVDWFLPLCKPVRVLVGNTPKMVIPHVHLAEYMCQLLRGTATGKAEDAGGDRLCRWKAYLGIVGNPIKVAALTVAADLEHHYGQLHNWCKRSCRKYGFGAGFKAHEIALSVLESEGVLKRAKADPKAFFKTTASYFESTSLHATPLTSAARTDFEERMQLAADAMYEMHRKWNWAWTEARFLMGAATSEEHRHHFVRQLLPLVGHGAALAAHLAKQKSPPPPPPPPGYAAEELQSRMAECQEGLKEEWQRWGHEAHLDEWLLLATEPRQLNMPLPLSEAPVLSRERTPGVFGVFIGQIFVRLSDNTCCESGVSEYRPRAHQNQHELRVEQRWKHSFRQRPLKDILRDPALRSTTGGARKPAALAAAARQKSLQHHARSKQQCAELWRDSLRRAMGYSWKEARLLKVAQARFKAREARDGAHEEHANAMFKSLTETHERGPGGKARRAACDVATAVQADAPLAEQGKRGGGKIYNLAAIRARFRDARADTKAAATAAKKARAAEKAAQREADQAKAARVAAAAQRRKEEEAERAAEEHVRATQETSERTARMWAHGREREQREQRQVAAARSRSYAGDDESDEEDGSEAESDAESSESEAEDEDEMVEGEDAEDEGWYGESIDEAAAVAAEQERERQQEEAAARMAEADREAEEREARTLTAREEMALRKLIKAKTNQLEAQLTNGVAGDSPLARGLRGEITDARERLQRAGVVLT